ncbi:MAG: YfiR family protein [Krumholzibacteria bacterium]|nr:YfiR family protein [Candidatus Krumholzibacteria bacterium]
MTFTMKVGRIAGRRFALCCLLALALAQPRATAAAARGLSTEDRIAAAFIFNFCKVVTWPIARTDTLTLAVIGDDGAAAALQELDGRSFGGGRLRVLGRADDGALLDCDLLYVTPGSGGALDSILARAESRPILTVSSTDEFCERGGMIQLVNNRGKIRLLINVRRAQAANLTISSQLLKMATIIEE